MSRQSQDPLAGPSISTFASGYGGGGYDPYGQQGGGYGGQPSSGGWYGGPSQGGYEQPPGWQGYPPQGGWGTPPEQRPPEQRKPDRGTEHRSDNTGTIVVGFFLVLLGAWFLFRDRIDLDMAELWPYAAVVVGLLMIVGAFIRRPSR